MKRGFKSFISMTLILSAVFMGSVKMNVSAEEAEPITLDEDVMAYLNEQENNNVRGLVGFEEGIESNDGLTSVIIEFNNPPAIVQEAMGRSLSSANELVENDHDSFEQAFNQMFAGAMDENPGIQIVDRYKSAINGVALDIPTESVEKLLELPSVKAVYPNYRVEMMASTTGNLQGGDSERDYMGISDLHAQGYTGSGVTIAILDTGIDYTHPDLKNAFLTKSPTGKANELLNSKFYGRNFVLFSSAMEDYGLKPREINDPYETSYINWKDGTGTVRPPETSNTGSAFYTSHGTHVAGTIVAQGQNAPTSALGIAPDAKIYSYRVLGPYGYGYISWILAGLEQLVIDKPDIVNMSLGSNVNAAKTLETMAINNIAIANPKMSFIIAAGNTGKTTGGLFTLGDPATATMATVVGNANVGIKDEILTLNSGIPSNNVSVNLYHVYNDYVSYPKFVSTGLYDMNYSELSANENYEYKLTPMPDTTGAGEVGYGNDADYALLSNTQIDGNILAMSFRGNSATANSDMISVVEKAKSKGAGMVILIVEDGYVKNFKAFRKELINGVPTYVVSLTDWWHIKNGTSLSGGLVKFVDLNNLDIYQLASTSSRGPVSDTYDIRPDVVAHGVNVLSTAPYYVNEPDKNGVTTFAYQRLSGTSMAAPQVAGVTALMKQYSNTKKLGWTALDIRSRLMNSATKLLTNYSVYEVGAGLINPSKAINQAGRLYSSVNAYSTTGIKTGQSGSINFGRQTIGVNVNVTKSFTLKNESNVRKTYHIYNMPNSSGQGVKKQSDASMGMTFSVSEFSIDPGKTYTTNVRVTFPYTTNTGHIGSYEGYIKVVNIYDENDVFFMPYATYLSEKLPGFEKLYLNQPVLSGNVNTRQLSQSSEIALYYQMNKQYTSMDIALVNALYPDYIIGVSQPTISFTNRNTLNTTYFINQAITNKYYPAVYDTNGNLTSFSGVSTSLAEGTYYAIILANKTVMVNNQPVTTTDQYTLPFYVSNTAPSLSVDNYNKVYNSIYYTPGQTSTVISGTIKDFAVESMQNFSMKYSIYGDNRVPTKSDNGTTMNVPGWGEIPGQDKNAIFVKTGTTIQRILVDVNGRFSFTIPTSNKSFTLYGLTSFNAYETSNLTQNPMDQNFNIKLPSYKSGNFGWMGINMVSKTINLTTTNPAIIVSLGTSVVPVKNIVPVKVNFNIHAQGDTVASYEVSDPTIATIDENGNLIAHAPGVVTIKVITANGLEAEETITVVKNVEDTVLFQNGDRVLLGAYKHLSDYDLDGLGNIDPNTLVYDVVDTPLMFDVKGYEVIDNQGNAESSLTLMTSNVIDVKNYSSTDSNYAGSTLKDFFTTDEFLNSFTASEKSALVPTQVEAQIIDPLTGNKTTQTLDNQLFYLPWTERTGDNNEKLSALWSSKVLSRPENSILYQVEDDGSVLTGIPTSLASGKNTTMLTRTPQDDTTIDGFSGGAVAPAGLAVEPLNGMTPIVKIDTSKIVFAQLDENYDQPTYHLTIQGDDHGVSIGEIKNLTSESRVLLANDKLLLSNLEPTIANENYKIGYKITQMTGDTSVVIKSGYLDSVGFNSFEVDTETMAMGSYSVSIWLEKVNEVTSNEAGVVYTFKMSVVNQESKIELQQLIDDALLVKKEDVVYDTFIALQEAIVFAQSIIDKPLATIDEIDEAFSKLNEALAGLIYHVAELDYTKANAVLERFKTLDGSKYTEYSWNQVVVAKEELESYINAFTFAVTTQDVIDGAVVKLESAIAQLQLKDTGSSGSLPETGVDSYLPYLGMTMVFMGLLSIIKYKKNQ